MDLAHAFQTNLGNNTKQYKPNVKCIQFMSTKPALKNILDLRNVTVYRGTNKVFNNLSLTLRLNENTAILGPNGSGKTTLLKLITRELMPVVAQDSHCQLFEQDRLTLWDLRKKIGLVSHEFQNEYRAVATGMDVILSAFFGAIGIQTHHEVTGDMRSQARAMLQQLGLASLASRSYLQLSTGQQRRLLLARALIHKPQVLIFDEPTSNLDLKASFQLIEDMRQQIRSGVTLILVTHHIHEIVPEISRVIFLKNGALVADGAKENVLTDRSISELYDVSVGLHANRGFYQAYSTKP